MNFRSFLDVLEISVLSFDLNLTNLGQIEESMNFFSLDIGDALNYQVLLNNEISTIFSKDQDWNRIPGIAVLSF